MNSIEIPQLGEEFNLNPPPPDTPLASARRVAIVAEAFLPKFDGVAKTALITLRHLQLTGREVLVFAPDTAPDTIGPSQVVRLPSISMPLYPKSRVALPNLAIRNHLASFKPDIIHLFSPALFSFSAAIIGLELSIPLVANYQTDLPGYAEQYGYPLLNPAVREWLKLIHNLCHLTLAPSTFTLNQIRGWGFKRVRYWGRGVNSQRFHPGHRSAAWRSRLLAGRPEDSLLCIYVGRLAVEKRIDLLRQVADVPGVALTIIGDGAAREELEKLYAGTGTLFTGYLFGSDLAAAYASADVFTFTGTHETFGQVTLEALASGLPVVVANSGGVTDMAIPGKTGIICDIYPESFAAASLELRDSPALRQQLACGAREFALHRLWAGSSHQI